MIRGTYYSIKWPIEKGTFEVLHAKVNVKDPIYDAKQPTFFTQPPTNYIYEGLMAFDPKHPDKYFNKASSHGYDMVILINDEKPLNVYRNNWSIWNRKERKVSFYNFNPSILPMYREVNTKTKKNKKEQKKNISNTKKNKDI